MANTKVFVFNSEVDNAVIEDLKANSALPIITDPDLADDCHFHLFIVSHKGFNMTTVAKASSMAAKTPFKVLLCALPDMSSGEYMDLEGAMIVLRDYGAKTFTNIDGITRYINQYAGDKAMPMSIGNRE